MLIQVDDVMHQAGYDLEDKVKELNVGSCFRIDKYHFDRETRTKHALCTIIQSGEWHKLVNYTQTPLLEHPCGKKCAIDIKTVDSKGCKRKLILTDEGKVYRLRKSKFENSLSFPGFV